MGALSPVTVWISQLRDGDPAAAQRLWDTYFGRMVKVARGKLHGALSRMADEEDVALSAFKSFCRGTQGRPLPAACTSTRIPGRCCMALTTHKAIDLMRHERSASNVADQGSNQSSRPLRQHFPRGTRPICRN